MHIVFFTRGHIGDVEDFADFLKTQSFTIPIKNIETGEQQNIAMSGLLQPIQLWSYVFPEEHKDIVLNTLFGDHMKVWGYGKASDLTLAAMRKGLKLKKIPKFDKRKSFFLPKEITDNIAITPVGIKEDIKDFKEANSPLVHEAI